jgi:hypothetical protein
VSWQDYLMNWIPIVIDAPFDLKKNELVKPGYNLFDWNDFGKGKSILFAHCAMINDRYL